MKPIEPITSSSSGAATSKTWDWEFGKKAGWWKPSQFRTSENWNFKIQTNQRGCLQMEIWCSNSRVLHQQKDGLPKVCHGSWTYLKIEHPTVEKCAKVLKFSQELMRCMQHTATFCQLANLSGSAELLRCAHRPNPLCLRWSGRGVKGFLCKLSAFIFWISLVWKLQGSHAGVRLPPSGGAGRSANVQTNPVHNPHDKRGSSSLKAWSLIETLNC